MRTVVSSAKRIKNRSFDALEKSFMNTIKNSGLRIDPWGTQWEIKFVLDLLLLYNIQSKLRSILSSS